jgi:hypothetical protein
MQVTFKNRPVEVDISYSGVGSVRDQVDMFVSYAVYQDTDAELTAAECEELTDQCHTDGTFYQEHSERLMADAEALADAYKDGTYGL